jgi:hypothetical protein
VLSREWLCEHRPACDRNGNFLFDPAVGRINAVLDGELAWLGDRHADLAYTMFRSFGQLVDGRFLVVGLVDRDEFVARYERRSGLHVDPVRLPARRRVQHVLVERLDARDRAVRRQNRRDPARRDVPGDDRPSRRVARGARQTLAKGHRVNPTIGEQSGAIRRRLTETIVPALPPNAELAIEQGSLILTALDLLCASHEHEYRYEVIELHDTWRPSSSCVALPLTTP